MADIKLAKALIKGLITFLPGIGMLLGKKKSKSTHSCSDPLFCYNLWLRILIYLKENNIENCSCRLGEIGNGGSFGTGICALLTGAGEYFALEIEEKLNVQQNIILLEAIVDLLKQKTPLSENSKINIPLKDYIFPEDLIIPNFNDDRFVDRLRNEIAAGFKNSSRIHLVKGWQNYPSLKLDMVFSRAVMEHVSNPASVYESAMKHLKNKSFMLHDIELHSHGITSNPDGHYKIPAFIWNLIFGRRKYFLNKWSLEDHTREIKNQGFKLLDVKENYELSDNRNVLTGASIFCQKYQS